MSEQKKAVVAKGNSLVVTGQGSPIKNVHYRLAALVVAAVVLLAALGGGGYWLATRNSRNAGQAHLTPRQQATRLEIEGQTGQAYTALDKAIAQTTSKSQQAALYTQKAGIAYDDQDYTKSLQAAQKAESLSPSAVTAQQVAEAAEAGGNKTLALQYYQLQLKRMQPVINADDVTRVQDKINSLEASK